jgi:nitrogenase molybdenum-cofactor synthesis protein NifE
VKQGADLLVAGVKERFLAYKLGVAFCDFNHDRTATFEGFDGIVNFAREVDITINSPVWNLPIERVSGARMRTEVETEIGAEMRREQSSVIDAGGETVV